MVHVRNLRVKSADHPLSFAGELPAAARPWEEVLLVLEELIEECTLLVAQSINFACNVLAAELWRQAWWCPRP